VSQILTVFPAFGLALTLSAVKSLAKIEPSPIAFTDYLLSVTGSPFYLVILSATKHPDLLLVLSSPVMPQLSAAVKYGHRGSNSLRPEYPRYLFNLPDTPRDRDRY
jgi:hypothetical protein